MTQYPARIATYEDRLNAIITVNPHALERGRRARPERAAGRVRGPLHGIPIALKDNIHTTDIRTTGGALAFRDLMPPYDATLTKNLRDGGAIIIAKTVLTELAHWTAGAPTPMVANYTGVAGFAFNPYDPRPDPRPDTFDGRPVLSTGGSSSGAGTAASFWAASVGSDTGGSIISPSNHNMLAGIRPTIGRISRYGVIPITADHDTAGPMARTVTDAAILMGVLESAAPDPNDAATKACTPPPNRDYTEFLDAGALKGARIGDSARVLLRPRDGAGRRRQPRQDGAANRRAGQGHGGGDCAAQGAGRRSRGSRRDPEHVSKDPADNFLLFDYCQGAEHKKGGDANCTVNFKYGMKRDFNAWLASLGDRGAGEDPHRAARVEPGARQGRRDALRPVAARHLRRDGRGDAIARGTTPTSPKDKRLSRDEGIDAALKAHKLDAILTPGGSGANLAARAGYPIIAVPFGMAPNAPTPPLPAGFNAKPAPFGVSVHGRRLCRAAADRDRVRVRAGEQTPRATAGHALTKAEGRRQKAEGKRQKAEGVSAGCGDAGLRWRRTQRRYDPGAGPATARSGARRASRTQVSMRRASGGGTPSGPCAATDSTSRRARNGFDFRCTALADRLRRFDAIRHCGWEAGDFRDRRGVPVFPEAVLDIALGQESDALVFLSAPDVGASRVHIAAARLVTVGKQVPLDAELAGGADERIDPALRETNRADAFQRQVVAHHLGHLRHDPELRFSFDEQPHPREHRHAAMHAEVIADAPQVLARQRARPQAGGTDAALVADQATDVCERRRRQADRPTGS